MNVTEIPGQVVATRRFGGVTLWVAEGGEHGNAIGATYANGKVEVYGDGWDMAPGEGYDDALDEAYYTFMRG